MYKDNKKLTGKYYIKKRFLGGFQIYVEEEYDLKSNDFYVGTEFGVIRWRKAKHKDLVNLGIYSNNNFY